jgi:hypothetical protein
MAEKLYQAWNGPTPTTAAQQKVTTGTVIKTLMQLATPTTDGLYIVEWGISFDGFAAAAPISVELLSCTGAATVTAYVAGDITQLTVPTGEATNLTLGTAASGYTASAEGTPAAVDMLDAQLISPMGQYVKQWPLGREPQVAISRFVRVRVTAAAAVNAQCYVVWSD